MTKQTKPVSTPAIAGKKRSLQPSPKHEAPADTTSNTATTTQKVRVQFPSLFLFFIAKILKTHMENQSNPK